MPEASSPAAASSRSASVERNTNETRISAAVHLDGTGTYQVATGIGFLDHMLERLSRHSLIDLEINAEGDVHIDFHHTTEDWATPSGPPFRRLWETEGHHSVRL